MNAGAYGGEFKDVLDGATALDAQGGGHDLARPICGSPIAIAACPRIGFSSRRALPEKPAISPPSRAG